MKKKFNLMIIKKTAMNVYIKLKQRTFITTEGRKLKYLFFRGDFKQSKLLVVFSAYPARHQKAVYNYVKTLKNSKANRLFILDDFGYEGVGSFYLGDKCQLYKEQAIEQLITFITNKYHITERWFVGSSKGGVASLIYGFRMNVDRLVIGSPAFRLGQTFLVNSYRKDILSAIIDIDESSIEWIDTLIERTIADSEKKTKVELVYSDREEPWADVSKLVQYLREQKIECELHNEYYTDHNEIGRVFSKYISQL